MGLEGEAAVKRSDWHRRVEWGKNLLIVLLTLSAIYLLTMLPLVQDSGLFHLLGGAEPTQGEEAGLSLTSVTVQPAAMAVNTEAGRYGVQYNQQELEALFARLGPLLGDALGGAGPPEAIDEASWQDYLTGSGIYFDFDGEIPLPVLCGWLSGDQGCALTGMARRLLLAEGEEDQLLLCYQEVESGLFYACSTGMTRTLHLAPNLDGYVGNGAYFAFEHQEYAGLFKPYTFITEEEGIRVRFSAANPMSEAGGVDKLLSQLAFHGQNHATVSSGEAYLDGEDRLQVNQDGTVTYRAGQGGKYFVADPTVAGVVEAARGLAQRTVGALCGEAQVHLISVQEEGGRYLIRFGYRLNGIRLYLYSGGWAAQFLVEDGYVTEFTLHCRTYASLEETVPLIPIHRAAALLPDLSREPRELSVQYRDRGDGTVSPGWVAN